MSYRVFTFIIATGFLMWNSNGQTDTSKSTNNNLSMGYDKNINTHRWDANIFYKSSFAGFDFHFDERFKSSLIRTHKNTIRDEQSVDFSTKYNISSPLKTSLKISSLVISDNQGIGISSVASHSVHGGFEYAPFSKFLFEPMVGFRIDRQITEQDAGVSYLLSAKTVDLQLGGFNTFFNGVYQVDRLDPRYLETQNLTLRFYKIFFEKTRNVLNITYKNYQRDFYFAADTSVQLKFNTNNNIEKRIEYFYLVQDTLDYSISNQFLFSANGLVQVRNIQKSIKYKPVAGRYFDNTIDDFRIEGAAQLAFQPTNSLNGLVQIFYGERDVTHSIKGDDRISQTAFDLRKRDEDKKNNYSRRSTLTANVGIKLSNSDRISFTGSSSILRYDTPSKLNDDDRDELWMAYNLTTYHNINRYLFAQIAVDANLSHVVYLLGSRSANNNWNRILRLSPRIQYIPSKSFSTTNRFEVLANYTVYDFEDLQVPVKSFSFRQFSFIDSTRISITPRVGFDWFSYISLYERGILNWKAFKGRPLNYFEDQTYILQTFYKATADLLFSTGIRYFSQTRFGYDGKTRQIETHLRSIGPVALITFFFKPKIELIVKGWRERIEYTNTQPRYTTNLTMNIKTLL
ncbi:MAG: hypothetical protein QME58_13095 [Bacteroidota bacterium]|nr:hypothetical protein [Bacteroidota bacterium]